MGLALVEQIGHRSRNVHRAALAYLRALRRKESELPLRCGNTLAMHDKVRVNCGEENGTGERGKS